MEVDRDRRRLAISEAGHVDRPPDVQGLAQPARARGARVDLQSLCDVFCAEGCT
jgi:hypothetical protein